MDDQEQGAAHSRSLKRFHARTQGTQLAARHAAAINPNQSQSVSDLVCEGDSVEAVRRRDLLVGEGRRDELRLLRLLVDHLCKQSEHEHTNDGLASGAEDWAATNLRHRARGNRNEAREQEEERLTRNGRLVHAVEVGVDVLLLVLARERNLTPRKGKVDTSKRC
jgi:hypothetical protein